MPCNCGGKKKSSHRRHHKRSESSDESTQTAYVVARKSHHRKKKSCSSSSSSSCRSCRDSACSGESDFVWGRGCSSVSSSSHGKDFSKFIKTSYNDCSKSSSSSSSSSSIPTRAQFCCCSGVSSHSKTCTAESSTSLVTDSRTTLYRSKKHHSSHHKDHHHEGKKHHKEYVVTCVVQGGKKGLCFARVGHKGKGAWRPILQLRLGVTYYFKIQCTEGMLFTKKVHTNEGFPLEGTQHCGHGEVFVFTATEEHLNGFYYGSSTEANMGGRVTVHA